jgi:carbonic anhydrase
VIKAKEALRLLQEGNDRFVAGEARVVDSVSQADRAKLVTAQKPFAVILGCSDSRVPVELIFDQGVGDLFVVRVAGNIAGPSQVGSIEFAVSDLGVRLIVVLGHTGCGAVRATLDELDGSEDEQTPGWQSVASYIQPSLAGLKLTSSGNGWGELYRQAIRANIKASASHLREEVHTLCRLIEEDDLMVVGAEYSLETGKVEFLEGS